MENKFLSQEGFCVSPFVYYWIIRNGKLGSSPSIVYKINITIILVLNLILVYTYAKFMPEACGYLSLNISEEAIKYNTFYVL